MAVSKMNGFLASYNYMIVINCWMQVNLNLNIKNKKLVTVRLVYKYLRTASASLCLRAKSVTRYAERAR